MPNFDESILYYQLNYLPPNFVFKNLIDKENVTFLDSQTQNSDLARFSYIAFEPFLKISCNNNNITINNKIHKSCLFETLKSILNKYKLSTNKNLNVPFQTGAIGYLSYELNQYLENLPKPKPNGLNIPDMVFYLYSKIFAFDLIDKKTYAITSGFNTINEDRLKYAKHQINELIAIYDKLKNLPKDNNHNEKLSTLNKPLAAKPITQNMSKELYLNKVSKVIDYIYKGEIFQTNFTQRFETKLNEKVGPIDVYQKQRTINPATFGAYFDCSDFQLLSSSPERLLKLNNNLVEARPIKGSIKRSDNKIEDNTLKNQLLNSEKDKAENTMIVDLVRNDLSKVCKPKSISVNKLNSLETYKSIHHLTSVVTAELKDNTHPIDLITSFFPGGSITGAPKVRAMEIIHELEPNPRGPYTGAFGYIGFDNNFDLSILIRTLTIVGDKVVFQTGGGIVADSNPLDEYQESLTKAKPFIELLSNQPIGTHDLNYR